MSKIIKSPNLNPVPYTVVKLWRDERRFDLASSLAERESKESGIDGEIILKEAEEEAARILKAARDEAGRVREEARLSGYKEGYEEGCSHSQREAEPVIKTAGEMLREAELLYQKAVRSSERELIKLAMKIAERILRVELGKRDDLAKGVIEDALKRVKSSSAVRIFVNPGEYHALKAYEQTLRDISGVERLEVISDNDIGAGGCIIETDNGRIDARLEKQLERVAAALDIGDDGR